MLLFVYLLLFLALSAALTWLRVANYQRRFEPARPGVREHRRL